MVLANKAAHTGDFSDAGNRLQLVAQVPVLKRPQIGETVLVAVVHESILVHPARASCVRPNCRMHISRQTARNRLQILQHARTSPIDIGAVFEHHEHIAIVEHRLGAHGLNVRSCEQCRHNRITNLVLDDVGRLAFPVGVNDDLDIGNVRQGVKRDMSHTPNSGQSEKENSRKDQEAIVSAPFNDTRNHGYIPPVALTESCLFAMVWPFCCAVIVTCHVPPDPRAPLPSYIPPPLSLAWTTVFIAAIPIAGIAAMKKVTLTCAPAIGFPA